MLLILLVYFIFALTFLIGKVAVAYVNPVLLIAIRMLIAGSLITSYAIIKKLKFPNFKIISFLSLVHIALPYCLEFIAFEYTAASKVAFIFNLSPFVTGVIEHFWYKYALNWRQWAALALGTLATSLVTFSDSNFWDCLACGWGEFLVFIAVVSGAAGWLYINKLLRSGYDILALNGSAMLGGGFLALSFAYLQAPNFRANLHYYSWFFIIILLVLGNLIAYNLYGWLLKRHRSTLLSLWGSVCPIFVALLEWAFFDQPPSLIFIFSSILIAIAIKMFLSKSDLK